MKRIYTLLTIAIIAIAATAQTIHQWTIYPSYTVCTKNVPAGHRVYAVMESKLMAYDTEDSSVYTWNTQNGLNDVTITNIAYCEDARRIVLVYDNGNIDLLSTEDDADIINLSQLKHSSMQSRQVNSITVNGIMAYLCTDFGIVAIDVEQATFVSTYQLGTAVNSCAVNDTHIFAGTASGIWRGPLTANLQDKANWTQVSSELSPLFMFFFDGYLWASVTGRIYRSNDNGATFEATDARFTPKYMSVDNGVMIVGIASYLRLYTTANKYTVHNPTFGWTDLHLKGDTYWGSCGNDGLQAFALQEDRTFAITTAGIHPNSPLHDYSYHLRLVDGRLFVAGGSYNYSTTSLSGTAMILEPDGTWVNFSAESAASIAPNSRFINVTHIAQDPSDAAHSFVGTARSGLYEFRDAQCVGHYTCDNSPLVSILPDNAHPQWFVVADGTRYDADGNLWVLNPSSNENDTIIRIMRPNGTWQGLYYPELNGITAMDNVMFDSRGWAWINSRRMVGRGYFCLDYNGTINTRSDDRHMLRSSFVNQDGTGYAPDEFYCAAEDLDGSIWIGTNLGPFRISDPTTFFSSECIFEQVKVARNDGSGLADYLLNSVGTHAIAIDGAGRKWFGTMGNGAYLISADGQEEIYHFTTDNSPLPSNDVDDIVINGTTGEVYFATIKGLCSFVAEATDAAETLDEDQLFVYPNPVTPDYNGPVIVRGLPLNSEVKIVAQSGQLICRGYSNGGTFTWDGCNQRGVRVASGMYHIIASTADGSKATSTKIAVIK